MYNETATQNQADQTVAVNVTYPKAKKLVNLKELPKYQTEETPKTKRRYMYEKTGNYVCYARAKQLGII
jgi:hypothetical protein